MPNIQLLEDEGGINDKSFKFFTQFTKLEIIKLANSLNLPLKYAYSKTTSYPIASINLAKEALLVFCQQATYLLAFSYLIAVFSYSRSWLLNVQQGVLYYIQEVQGTRIEQDTKLITKAIIKVYCNVIGKSLGAEQELIFSFINSTKVAILRPITQDQQLFFSSYKKQHSLSHLAIIMLIGLLSSVLLGVPSAGSNAILCIALELSKHLGELLDQLLEGEYRYVYGNAAFSSQDYVLGPYKKLKNGYLISNEKAINYQLSKKRISVEHAFRGVKNKQKLLQLRTSLIARLSLVGLYFLVFAFLTNCRTCIRGGNQISSMFNIAPPSLEAYLSSVFEEWVVKAQEYRFDQLRLRARLVAGLGAKSSRIRLREINLLKKETKLSFRYLNYRPIAAASYSLSQL